MKRLRDTDLDNISWRIDAAYTNAREWRRSVPSAKRKPVKILIRAAALKALLVEVRVERRTRKKTGA